MTRSMSSRPSFVSLKACSAIAEALRLESETVSTHSPTPCLEDIVSTVCWALEASRIPRSSVTCLVKVVLDAAGRAWGAAAATAMGEASGARGTVPATVVGAATALAEAPSSPRTAAVAAPEVAS